MTVDPNERLARLEEQMRGLPAPLIKGDAAMDFLRKAALVLIALFLGGAGLTAARSRECPSSRAVAVAAVALIVVRVAGGVFH